MALTPQQPQQFCVRWNSYHTNLQAVFPRLLLTEQFADVTLACEAKQLRCHKLVLSACSAYLERLLLQNPCDHPIVLMRDMRFSEMQALVDFMYKGEVNVTQEELPSLLKSAEALQIRGLCSGESGATGEGRAETRDFTLASDALVANVHKETANAPQQQQQQQHSQQHQQHRQTANTTNGPKKRKSEERERDKPEVKEETVEEDGLYYGELDNDHLEYNEDEESGKPGSSLGQTSGKYIRVKPESELIFNLNTNEAENDFYKSWLEKNGELEVSLKPKLRKRGRPPIFKEKSIDLDKNILKSDLDQFLEGKEVSSSGVFRKDLERIMMGKFNPNRRYSNEAMWAALMDVKKGGSIYRAAQTHKVPRKSLRNWMKRCHIKSSFPMPQQLKQFVENSKKQREVPEKTQNFHTDIDFGKHFLSNQVSSEDEKVDGVGEFAIANVQCQYECSDTEGEERHQGGGGGGGAGGGRGGSRVTTEHNYDTRDEPPAFIIHQIPASSTSQGPFVEVRPGLMTLAPGCVPAVNVIHIGDRSQITNNTVVNNANAVNTNNNQEYNMSMNKRIRRSEVELRQAADCVSRGSTFQTVSEQFNIPISTIRFFMARKGILPRRRRGRSTHSTRTCSSPEEPPFHMQHFKLPDMLALKADDEPNT